jgi:hypothetical protein
MRPDFEHTLRMILADLQPYRSDLILIGGWVPYLYRRYGGFASWGGEDTLTFELDVLVGRPLPPGGRPGLADVLGSAGFRPVSRGIPAAVWERDIDAGERIEFITVHRGTAKGEGNVVPLAEQPGIGAIPLTELEVIRSHTRILVLPPLHGFGAMDVQVPTLGAYVVNKALTFMRRQTRTDEAGVPKLAKDLLYLRDLAAAGDEVVAAIEADLEVIARSHAADAERIRAAATNLGFAVESHLDHHVAAAAMMVLEREPGASIELEEVRTRAFLLDLRALLLESADRHGALIPGDDHDVDEY